MVQLETTYWTWGCSMNELERDWIEGKLCEDGLMKEHWDESEKDLVRNLTPEGRQEAKELLTNPEYMKFALEMCRQKLNSLSLPIEVKKKYYLKVKAELEQSAK